MNIALRANCHDKVQEIVLLKPRQTVIETNQNEARNEDNYLGCNFECKY